ncbi:hypothetical protein P7K49_035275, partial [Saguinus oedipus]
TGSQLIRGRCDTPLGSRPRPWAPPSRSPFPPRVSRLLLLCFTRGQLPGSAPGPGVTPLESLRPAARRGQWGDTAV